MVPGGGIGQPEGAKEAKKRMKKSFHFIIEHSREKSTIKNLFKDDSKL